MFTVYYDMTIDGIAQSGISGRFTNREEAQACLVSAEAFFVRAHGTGTVWIEEPKGGAFLLEGPALAPGEDAARPQHEEIEWSEESRAMEPEPRSGSTAVKSRTKRSTKRSQTSPVGPVDIHPEL